MLEKPLRHLLVVRHLLSALAKREGHDCFLSILERGRLEEDLRRIRPDLGGHIPKIEDGPWPAFPADLTSIALTVATQAFGTVLIFEKMFESRLFFVDKLVGMGARIIVCDPHRVVVAGPAKLYGHADRSRAHRIFRCLCRGD